MILYEMQKVKEDMEFYKGQIKICEEIINSPIYPYLKEVGNRPKEYFTEEVTLEVNNHLKDTGWRFYGKREEKREGDKKPFFFASFGPRYEYKLVYYKEEEELRVKIGEFDMDSLLKRHILNLERTQKELEKVQKELIKFNTYKEELQAQRRARWLEKIKTLSLEEIADILSELELDNNALNQALIEEGAWYDVEEYLANQFHYDNLYAAGDGDEDGEEDY